MSEQEHKDEIIDKTEVKKLEKLRKKIKAKLKLPKFLRKKKVKVQKMH